MKFNAKTVVFAALSVIAFGNMAPAFAQKVVQPSERACRRVISNVGGPEQPRAVAGLNYDQIPVYTSPSDVYGGTATEVLKIGDVVFLSQPQEARFINDPNDQNGLGVQMIAIDTDQGQRWIPLADGAIAGGRDSVMVTPMSKSNLGYCSVRGMW